jgi:hypothetical protein
LDRRTGIESTLNGAESVKHQHEVEHFMMWTSKAYCRSCCHAVSKFFHVLGVLWKEHDKHDDDYRDAEEKAPVDVRLGDWRDSDRWLSGQPFLGITAILVVVFAFVSILKVGQIFERHVGLWPVAERFWLSVVKLDDVVSSKMQMGLDTLIVRFFALTGSFNSSFDQKA